MTHYTNTNNPIDFPKKKEIPMLEKFAAQSLVEYEGELIFSKEKFAELIVAECLAIAKNREDELESAGLLDESNAVGNVSYRISRQFGVKR